MADNQWAQTIAAARPNEIWVTAITYVTYVPTEKDQLYLAGVKDLHTCEVVGHAMRLQFMVSTVDGHAHNRSR